MNLLLHANKKFSHQTVHITGHAFRNCLFECCTIVVKAMPTTEQFDAACRMNDCVWHLDLVVHDPATWQSFLKLKPGEAGQPLSKLIFDSLPRPPLDDRLPQVEEVPQPEDVA